MTTESAKTRYLRHALVLGLVAAVGPFSIDMYLPSLPSIGASLQASGDQVQLSLMGFFLAFGVGGLFFGPLSDRYGRKGPIYIGLVVFALGSIGCATASSVWALVAFRVVQGLGASSGMTLSQAVVRDLHTGPEATKLMALLMLVFSTSPILAPLVGSFLVEYLSWRWVFWVVTAISMIGLVVSILFLEETRPAEARQESGLGAALRGYGTLLRDWHFLGLAFIGAFGLSSFFVFLGASSFVYIGHYGLTPRLYGLAFSINAVAFIGAAQFNGWLTGKFGLRPVAWIACLGFTAGMLVLLAVTLAGIDNFFVLAALLFVSYGCLGLVLPTSTVIALEDHGAIAGTASSLLGTLQMLTGSLCIAAAGTIADGTPRPMVIGIVICAVITLAFAWYGLKYKKVEGTVAAE